MRKILLLIAMLLVARMIQAQDIIYDYFDPVSEYPLAAQSSLDFNGDGINELQINFSAYDLGPNWTSMYFTLSGPAQSLSPFLQGLSAGTTIGTSSGEWAELSGPVIYWSSYNGQTGDSQEQFALSSDAPYLPVRFALDDGVHYGWVRFTTDSLIGFRDWAYESSPNTSISAGAVPEPSIFALWSMSALAFWRACRRGERS
jgi:hypothetical protein